MIGLLYNEERLHIPVIRIVKPRKCYDGPHTYLIEETRTDTEFL